MLNFSAVEFISNVDDTIFLLAKWGYFGPRALKDASTIEDAKPVENAAEYLLEEKEKDMREHLESNIFVTKESIKDLTKRTKRDDRNRCRCSRRALILLSIWLAMLIAWVLLSVDQGSGKFMPEFIDVQFGDDHMAALGTFSGLYKLDKKSGPKIFGGRKKYVSETGGKFEYCEDEKIWTFSFGEKQGIVVADPCRSQKHLVRAQSAESDVFDLTRTPMDPWYYRGTSNLTQLVPIRHFSVGKQPKSTEDCGPLAVEFSSDDGYCNCESGWFGSKCRLGSCQAMQIKEGVFNDTIQWSTRYEMQPNGAGFPLQVYGRPVFVGKTRANGNTDVIFFTGRRWVLTHTGRFSVVNESRRSDITSLFNEHFHGYWTSYNVAYVSEAVEEPVDLDDTNQAAIPTGLAWFRTDITADTLTPNEDWRSNAILACTCSNSTMDDAFKCENDGVCLEDGTCSCVGGSRGERCEVSAKANGFCNNNDYFNSVTEDFDGGDCCNITVRLMCKYRALIALIGECCLSFTLTHMLFCVRSVC